MVGAAPKSPTSSQSCAAPTWLTCLTSQTAPTKSSTHVCNPPSPTTSLPPSLQALANNLLTRAVHLSRHAAVGPDAAACCAIAVAELQLEQARQMMAKGGTMCSLAVALLSSSYQQLSSADLQAATAAGSCHRAGLLGARKAVLVLLCKAHLATGEAALASKALDALESEAPGAAAAEAELQLVYVEVKVAAGRVAEGLRFLMGLMKQADLAAPDGKQAAATFLAGLRTALALISEDTLPSFQSAVGAFVWKATAGAPAALLSLVQALLAQEQVCVAWKQQEAWRHSAGSVRVPPFHVQALLLTAVRCLLACCATDPCRAARCATGWRCRR